MNATGGMFDAKSEREGRGGDKGSDFAATPGSRVGPAKLSTYPLVLSRTRTDAALAPVGPLSFSFFFLFFLFFLFILFIIFMFFVILGIIAVFDAFIAKDNKMLYMVGGRKQGKRKKETVLFSSLFLV